MQCRFNSDPLGSHDGDTAYESVDAVYLNETHVLCYTPDWTDHFAADLPESASLQEVYLQLSEFDGTFREAWEIRYRYYETPVISQYTPPDGFASQQTQV